MESGTPGVAPVIQIATSSPTVFQKILHSATLFATATPDRVQDFTWYGSKFQIMPFPHNDDDATRTQNLIDVRNIDQYFRMKCVFIHIRAVHLPPELEHWNKLYELPTFEGIFPTFVGHYAEPVGYDLYLQNAPDTFTLDAEKLRHYPGFPIELLPPPVAAAPQQLQPQQNGNVPVRQQNVRSHAQRFHRLAERITRRHTAQTTTTTDQPSRPTPTAVSPERSPRKRAAVEQSPTQPMETEVHSTPTSPTGNTTPLGNHFTALQQTEHHDSDSSATMDEKDFEQTTNTPAELVALLQQYHITTATHSQSTYEEMLTLATHVYKQDSAKTAMLLEHLQPIRSFREEDKQDAWDYATELLNSVMARTDRNSPDSKRPPQRGHGA